MKAHPWFEGFDWSALDKKLIPSPFVPELADNFDAKISNDEWNDEEEKMREAALLLQEEST